MSAPDVGAGFSLSIAKSQFPFLLTQFECKIQNFCLILFLDGLVVHISPREVCLTFEVAKPPVRIRAHLHRIYIDAVNAINTAVNTNTTVSANNGVNARTAIQMQSPFADQSM